MLFSETTKGRLHWLKLVFTVKAAHRGAAFGDFDGDGRIDIVVSALGEPAELWRNLSTSKSGWLDVKLVGSRSNRDGIGAVVRVGGQTNIMTSAVSYASSSLGPVHFGGLGEVVDVEVLWPTGKKQKVQGAMTGRVVLVEELAK